MKEISKIFGGSKSPKPAPPPPPPTMDKAADMAANRQRDAQIRANAVGLQSTILTSGQGAIDENKSVKKKLFGE